MAPKAPAPTQQFALIVAGMEALVLVGLSTLDADGLIGNYKALISGVMHALIRTVQMLSQSLCGLMICDGQEQDNKRRENKVGQRVKRYNGIYPA